jgi:2-amino-1-hydroxyethylphosphonate dioxygenase (glycine-forming)
MNNKADAITSEIMFLFDRYGHEDYDGEPVSQTTHMIQCAMHAMADGEDMELILGAFLHDLGHLIRPEQHPTAMGMYGVANHEGVGGEYLRKKGFSERICAMVEKHVDAKRYLVATDPSYKEKLSEASLQTLNMWQGGPMTEYEIILFKQHPYFDDIIKVRLWDEGAKSREMVMLPLHHFRHLIHEYLKGKN